MLFEGFKKLFTKKNFYLYKFEPILQEINSLEKKYQKFSDEEFKEQCQTFRKELTAGKSTLDDILPSVFAMVREASVRVTGMRIFDVQMQGGFVLHNGLIDDLDLVLSVQRVVDSP